MSGILHDRPEYTVKVRGLTFLWGSAGITQNLHFDSPFILSVANDYAGQPVAIGTRAAVGTASSLGVLQPGESVSISVNNVSGVYADCALDTVVHCFIHTATV